MIAASLWMLGALSPFSWAEEPSEPAAEVASALSQGQTERVHAIEISMSLKVPQQEQAMEAMLEQAEARGGYLLHRYGSSVTLRVPSAEADALVAEIQSLGSLITQSRDCQDITYALIDQRSQIRSREELMTRYFELIRTADGKGTLKIEREIADILQDLEMRKGDLKVMEHSSRMAVVKVELRLRDRSAPSSDGFSSFGWINTLNMQVLLDDFSYHAGESWRRTRTELPTPDGFSRYDDRDLRAVSPEGVVLRLRTEPHDPEAELDFWDEAVLERMSSAGYTPHRRTSAQLEEQGWMLHEYLAPLGEKDMCYGVAFQPGDRWVQILEWSGEATDCEARREALLSLFESLGETELLKEPPAEEEAAPEEAS